MVFMYVTANVVEPMTDAEKEKIRAFLADLTEVSRRHNLILALEECGGYDGIDTLLVVSRLQYPTGCYQMSVDTLTGQNVSFDPPKGHPAAFSLWNIDKIYGEP